MNTKIDFSSKFRTANIASIIIFLVGIFFILFKGLNYGIDFKGGTLIELRTETTSNVTSQIRSALSSDINIEPSSKIKISTGLPHASCSSLLSHP